MQLDKTRIAIRERSFADLLDLALRVIREHVLALSATFAIGVIPLALFNHWWLAESLEEVDLTGQPPYGYLFGSLFWIVWELPLAAAPTTVYLGKALFDERPSALDVGRDLVKSLPQLILFQVVLRGMLTLFVFTWPVLFFLGWPYLNEVLLLERNPWRKRGTYGSSTSSRCASMHSGNRGELFSRWLASITVAAGLVLAISGALVSLQNFVTFRSTSAETFYAVDLPVAEWIVIGYFMVVRYLSYLDLRIRTEGWEVELTMRAEAARLARQIA